MIQMRWNVTFFGCVMPLALASVWYDVNSIINGTIVLLRLSQMSCNMTFLSYDDIGNTIGITFVMWTALSMTPLHSLGQDDQNEVKHVMWHYWYCYISQCFTECINVPCLCIYIVLGCLGIWLHIFWSCDALSLHISTCSSGSMVFACLGGIKEACT